jgi:hypothetical protein
MTRVRTFNAGDKPFLAMSDAERKDVLVKSLGLDRNARRRAARRHAKFLSDLAQFCKEQKARNRKAAADERKRSIELGCRLCKEVLGDEFRHVHEAIEGKARRKAARP